jgi:hypothetical protein
MSQERIEILVRLLWDKGDEEREQAFKAFGLTDEERKEVLRRILEYKPPLPKGLSPEELREHKHFRQLVAQARRGQAILFIGAGVSVDVGMPTTSQLLDALRAEAKNFGTEIPTGTPFSEAARIMEGFIERANLVGVLRREFDAALKADPPPYRRGAYRLLPSIPQLSQLIVTTNWDDLIKRAFQDAGEQVVEITQGAQLPLIPSAEHAVIKLHGGFENPEGMVLTESDFDIAEAQIRRGAAGTLWCFVANLLAQRSFIFIGYSLQDPDFRLLRRMVESGMGTRREPVPHFFVAPLSKADEEAISKWAEVRPIPATATDFLLALFRELGEFANRLDELDMIFSRQSPPFIELYGHFGCGKSALLDEAEYRARAKGWLPHQILRVNFDRRPDGSPREPIDSMPKIIQALNEDLRPDPPIKRFEDFGLYLKEKRGVFLIFDATERVQNQQDLVLLISKVVAPALQEMLERGQRAKLLLAGRFPLQGWPYNFRRNFRSYALTPFKLSDVQEMARKFLLSTDLDSQERFEPELLNDVLEVSGGHALFIKQILTDLVKEERRQDGRIRLPRCLTEDEKRSYMRRFNEEIDQHIAWGHLQKVYAEQLCVFRWLNREIVRELRISPDPLHDLTAIYVLSPTDFYFYADPVIRRIKTLWLRYEHPESFAEAQQRAQKIFAAGMERLTYPYQLDYIVEWLFHTVHLLLVVEPEDAEKRRTKLIEQIKEHVRYRAYLELVREDIGAQLVSRIVEKDPELWPLLERCIGREGLEEVLPMLEQMEVQNVGVGY